MVGLHVAKNWLAYKYQLSKKYTVLKLSLKEII